MGYTVEFSKSDCGVLTNLRCSIDSQGEEVYTQFNPVLNTWDVFEPSPYERATAQQLLKIEQGSAAGSGHLLSQFGAVSLYWVNEDPAIRSLSRGYCWYERD